MKLEIVKLYHLHKNKHEYKDLFNIVSNMRNLS